MERQFGRRRLGGPLTAGCHQHTEKDREKDIMGFHGAVSTLLFGQMFLGANIGFLKLTFKCDFEIKL